MQFTLRDLLLLFVVLASALGTFHFIIAGALFILVLLCAAWKRSTSPATRTTLLLLMLFWCFFCCCCGLLPAISTAREAVYRSACVVNLKQIGVALHNYQSANQHLPLAITRDAEGKPLHSWRTMILPMLEWGPLFDRLDLQKPWNGPENKKLLSTAISVYACPAAMRQQKPHLTNYVVITGPDTLWPDDRPGDLSNIPDGASNTILAVEIGQSDIAWGEPRDLTLQEMEERLNSQDPEEIFSWHGYDEDGFYLTRGRGVNVLFADGSVQFFRKSGLRKYLKALVTPNGGEKIPDWESDEAFPEEEDPPRLNWPWIIPHGLSLLIFITSSLLLIFLPVKRRSKSNAEESDENTVPSTEEGTRAIK
ncbi:MAG: DUF1559 domain-containing protein [Pirellulales bacterium]|nr:DUF1559 domain-containing protein [Pirellulales bacterium]